MMESKKQTKFKELTAKLSKDELLRRLKTISLSLSNVDQEDSRSDDFAEIAASLVATFVIKHRDKDIKGYAACCLADILRIYAPEPPYNEDQLKDVFRLMVDQLKCLDRPDSPSYKRPFYLLESLAMVKSFNICADIDAQNIIVTLFTVFFSVINDKHSSKVKTFMLDVMAPIIQEGESLSQELLDAILINLVEPRKGGKPVAYSLAASLIDRTSSSIEPYIQMFFNNALVLGKETETEIEKHLYDLILELNKISRGVLLSVLPQLEFKLKSEDEEERLEIVRVLGKMFSDEDSDLASQNKPLWNTYLSRFHDISPEVRIECTQKAKYLMLNKPDLLHDVADRIHERFHDPDEKVRLVAVVSVCEVAAEKIDMIPTKLFDDVKERMRDKKWPIRKEAMTCVAKLYKRIMMGQDIKKKMKKKILWAPSKLLHGYFQQSLEDRVCLERIVHGCLVPVSLDMEERMKTLLNLYAILDESALNAFNGMLKFRASVNFEFKNLLATFLEDPGDEKEKRMFGRILALARLLPEPFKAQEHLKRFVTMFSDKQLYQLLKTCVNVVEGCPKIMNAMADVMKKITSKNPIIETVRALLDRGCYMLIDSQSLLLLLMQVKNVINGFDDDEDNDDEDNDDTKATESDKLTLKAKRGMLLIKAISDVVPDIFKTTECFEQLLQFTKHEDEFIAETTLKILFHVSDGLEAFDKQICSCFQPVLTKIAVNGIRKQAIYAVRSLSKMLKDSSSVFERLFNTLVNSLDFNSAKISTTLASLGEIAIHAPSIFQKRHKDVIRDFVVKDLLVIDREITADSQESEDEWGPNEDVSRATQIKVQGIKVMTKWLFGLQSGHRLNATPVFRLLDTLLKHDGDLNANGSIGPQDRSRLRLSASNCFIKLAQNSNYLDVITIEQYQQVALTIQDSCYEVREKFSVKLYKALDTLKLPLDYLAYFALTAVDPSKDRKLHVRQMIAKCAQKRRDFLKQHSAAAERPFAILPEYALSYVIHLLAHHPDFNHKDTESLNETQEYLWFFLEPLMGAKAENFSFLKKLLENIKQMKDAQEADNTLINEKLYTVCDLCIGLIINKTTTIVLKDFPGSPVLPKKLFIPVAEKALNAKNYLPKGYSFVPKQKKHCVLDIKTSVSSKPKPINDTKTISNKKQEKTNSSEESTKKTTKKEIEEKEDSEAKEDNDDKKWPQPFKKRVRSSQSQTKRRKPIFQTEESSEQDSVSDPDSDEDDDTYLPSKKVLSPAKKRKNVTKETGNKKELGKSISAVAKGKSPVKGKTKEDIIESEEEEESSRKFKPSPIETVNKKNVKQQKIDDFVATSKSVTKPQSDEIEDKLEERSSRKARAEIIKQKDTNTPKKKTNVRVGNSKRLGQEDPLEDVDVKQSLRKRFKFDKNNMSSDLDQNGETEADLTEEDISSTSDSVKDQVSGATIVEKEKLKVKRRHTRRR